jgi:hypothetical protein
MIYRAQGYLSDSATELIKVVRNFNWEHEPLDAAPAAPRASHGRARPPQPPRRGAAGRRTH